MGLLAWLKGRGPVEDPRLREWRRDWTRAAEAWDTAAVDTLRGSLEAMHLPEEEIEVEREMVDALAAVAELAAATGNGLPAIETGHRVVGTDVCHFSSPASMPDEPAQPSGRVLLTSARAIFVGGAATGTAIAWHSVIQAAHAERDLILVRTGGNRVHRFRFNTFGDAMCAAYLARRLSRR